MMLSDIRDYVESLGIAENVCMGKLDGKLEKAVSVYNSKHMHTYKVTLGGPEMASYGTKYITLLVHWNKSPRDTEKSSNELFERLARTREETINNKKIKFIQPLYEIQDVDTDDNGIYEMVIEAAVIYERS